MKNIIELDGVNHTEITSQLRCFAAIACALLAVGCPNVEPTDKAAGTDAGQVVTPETVPIGTIMPFPGYRLSDQ